MAKFYSLSDNYLVKEKEQKKKILFVFLILGVIVSFALTRVMFSLYGQLILSYSILLPFLIGCLIFRKQVNSMFQTVKNFAQGKQGEDEIEKILQTLPDDVTILYDVNLPGMHENIDFIMLTPTNIFTIEVKSHKGNITYENGELKKNGYSVEKNFLSQAKREALALHDFLLQNIQQGIWIKPVLVFSSDHATVRFGMKPIDDVIVIQKGYVHKLVEIPSTRSIPVDQIVERLQSL